MSYMLTCVFTILALGLKINVPILLVKQIAFGLIGGYILAKIAIRILETIEFTTEEAPIIFLLAIGIIGYSLPCLIGGNGYLSVYLAGIIMVIALSLTNKYMLSSLMLLQQHVR